MSDSHSTPSDDPSLASPAPSEWEYANRLEKRLPPTRCVGNRWFCYDKGVWEETSSQIFRPIAQNIFPATRRTERKAQVLLSHLEGRWQTKESLFHGTLAFTSTGSVIINILNGVLEVWPDKVTLKTHDAGHYFTRCLNVAYDPKSESPLYLSTLDQSLPDANDRHLFKLCMGNFLLPDCRFETALVCYGESGSGKSTLAHPIELIFGTSDRGLLTRLSMSQICDPNCYSLAKLRYACVNLGTELQSIAVEESANFKTLVSGESLEARPIYHAPFTMHTHCKFWFLANNLPRFKNGTDAELRRMRFLRFEMKPEKPDVLLKQKLEAETSGVFNLMIAGLQEALRLARMPYGGQHSQNVHERFKVSNDPLGTFVKRFCLFSREATVAKATLQEAFAAYCDIYSLPKAIDTHFFKLLYERFPDVQEMRKRDPKASNGRLQTISGIMLTEAAFSSLVVDEEKKAGGQGGHEAVRGPVDSSKIVSIDLSTTSAA